MSLIRSTIISSALSILLLGGNSSAASEPKVDEATAKLAAAATPMKAIALENLYGGKTWKWKTGGGFFSTEDKEFSAWSHKGSAWSYGEGRWFATDSGKLCLRALWSSKEGGSGAVTCFLHREKDGVIYQKPNLGGSWYVFRHNPVQKGDEALKLIKGDQVTGELSRLKKRQR